MKNDEWLLMIVIVTHNGNGCANSINSVVLRQKWIVMVVVFSSVNNQLLNILPEIVYMLQ